MSLQRYSINWDIQPQFGLLTEELPCVHYAAKIFPWLSESTIVELVEKWFAEIVLVKKHLSDTKTMKLTESVTNVLTNFSKVIILKASGKKSQAGKRNWWLPLREQIDGISLAYGDSFISRLLALPANALVWLGKPLVQAPPTRRAAPLLWRQLHALYPHSQQFGWDGRYIFMKKLYISPFFEIDLIILFWTAQQNFCQVGIQ